MPRSSTRLAQRMAGVQGRRFLTNDRFVGVNPGQQACAAASSY